jgi:hypothetical protein
MWILGLAIVGLLVYEVALKHFTTKAGVQCFTQAGQTAALKILHAASATLPASPVVIPNAAVFQVVQFQAAGLSAEGVVNSAATRGANVFLTKNVFQADGQPILIAITTDPATLGQPGSQFARLAPL